MSYETRKTSYADMLTLLEITFLQDLALNAGYDSDNVVLGPETPSGLVNGSNRTYTVSNQPKFLIIDGSTYFEGVPGAQPAYTYSGGTITVDALITPTQYIRSFY